MAGGGGIDTTDADATASDILTGKTAYVKDQKVTGTYVPLDTSDATAVALDILNPKTAYVNGKKITGAIMASKIYTGAVSTVSLNEYNDIAIPFDYHRISETLVYLDASSNVCFAKIKNDTEIDIDSIRKYSYSNLGNNSANTILDIKLSKLPNANDNYYLIMVNTTNILYIVELNLKTFEIISRRTLTMGHNCRFINFNPVYDNIVAITGHYTQYSTTNTYMQIVNLDTLTITYSYRGSVSGSYVGTAPSSYWCQWDSTGCYLVLNTLVHGSTYGDQRGPNNNQQTLFHFNSVFNGATKVIDKTVNNSNSGRGSYLTTNPLMFYVSTNKIYYNKQIYEINGDTATLVNSSAGINIFNYVWDRMPFNNPMMASNVGDKVILAYNLYNASSYQIKIYTFNNNTNKLTLYNTISLSSVTHLSSYLDYIATYTQPSQKSFIYSATSEIITGMSRNNENFYNTIDATATGAQLLNGTAAYGQAGKIYGTMPNNGALNYTPSEVAQTIPAGYTSGGTIAAINYESLGTITPEEVVEAETLTADILS